VTQRPISNSNDAASVGGRLESSVGRLFPSKRLQLCYNDCMSAQRLFRRFGWFTLFWGTLLVISGLAAFISISGQSHEDTSLLWLYLVTVLPIPFIGYGLLRSPEGVRFACNLYGVFSIVLIAGSIYRNFAIIHRWEDQQPDLIDLLDPHRQIYLRMITEGIKKLWFPVMLLWMYRVSIDLQPLSEYLVTRKFFKGIGFLMLAWGILSIPNIDTETLGFGRLQPTGLTMWMWVVSQWADLFTVLGYLVLGFVLITGNRKPSIWTAFLLLFIIINPLANMISSIVWAFTAASSIANPYSFSAMVLFNALNGMIVQNGLVVLILFFTWSTFLPDFSDSLRRAWRVITGQETPPDSPDLPETSEKA
jgi:hypothetical protein